MYTIYTLYCYNRNPFSPAHSLGNFLLPLLEGAVPSDILRVSDPYQETLNKLSGRMKGDSGNAGSAVKMDGGAKAPLRVSPDGACILLRVTNPILTSLQKKLEFMNLVAVKRFLKPHFLGTD